MSRILKSQMLRKTSCANQSLLPELVSAYMATDLRLTNSEYLFHLKFKHDGALGSPRCITEVLPFGHQNVIGTKPHQPLGWDCADIHLEGADRVRFSGVDLLLDDAVPFDLQASSAPAPLKSLAAQAPRVTWWQVQYRSITFVFSSLSVIERMIAPNARIAAFLLSPYREIALRRSLVDAELTLKISASDVGLNDSILRRESIKNPAEILCLAYWSHRRDGFEALDQIAQNIYSGSTLLLPSVPETIRVNAAAIRVGKTIYAQSLSTATGRNRWPIAWHKLTMLGGFGRGGLELTKRNEVENARDTPFANLHLNKAQCFEVLQRLGWLTLSKKQLLGIAYRAGTKAKSVGTTTAAASISAAKVHPGNL